MTIILGCKNCGEPKERDQDYCPTCILKAKQLGATAEINRRAREQNKSYNAIISELIIYALDKQKEEMLAGEEAKK